jgi:hypothetical protein
VEVAPNGEVPQTGHGEPKAEVRGSPSKPRNVLTRGVKRLVGDHPSLRARQGRSSGEGVCVHDCLRFETARRRGHVVPLFDDGGTFAACALCPVQRAGGCFNERVIVVTPVRYRRGAHKLPPEAMQRHSPVPRSIAKIGPRGPNWTPDRHYAFSEHNAICRRFESGRQDLNLRPPGPQPGALPDCATPRMCSLQAGDGNRTRPRSLEGFCATTTLRPRGGSRQ